MYNFDKSRRLNNKKEYDYVFKEPNKTLTPEFILLHRKNTLGYARLGLALSKKMIAKACQRNRIKRLLRERFRLQNLPAIDLIVLARHGVDKVENDLIDSHLGKAWKKLTEFYAG